MRRRCAIKSWDSGQTVSAEIIRVRSWIEPLKKLPEAQGDIAAGLAEWSGALLAFSQSLSSLDGILGAKERLESGWAATPGKLKDDLKVVRERLSARPDKSATIEANAFLVVAQERLNNLRIARRNTEEKKSHAARGKTAYRIYNEVSEAALLTLYQQVEEEFGSYYRLINQDDEGEFKARFEPAEGKLGLLVDFHKKGHVPAAAYHSEGHQDGMGVCLYLALMRRVLDKNFTFAVLDDVVSSVDSQHRKQFCKPLKTKFANTQFIITTHDQVWAKQLRTEGVVNAKTAVAFHTWTVETGPVLDEVAEVWDKIDADLAKNEVPTAAGRLRRHLEFVAADLADELGAKVSFRADGGYDMGELLSAVIGRQGELLKSAAKAAKSLDDAEAIAKVEALRQARQQVLSEKEGEHWGIHKAIHYNESGRSFEKRFQTRGEGVQGIARTIPLHQTQMRFLAISHAQKRSSRSALCLRRVSAQSPREVRSKLIEQSKRSPFFATNAGRINPDKSASVKGAHGPAHRTHTDRLRSKEQMRLIRQGLLMAGRCSARSALRFASDNVKLAAGFWGTCPEKATIHSSGLPQRTAPDGIS